MTPAERQELAELDELERLEGKYASAGTRQHREVPGAGYRPESPQQPLPPTFIGTDILTGLRTAGRNIGKNIGIPGTDIDLNALLERFGARPIAEVRKEYEAAGWPAGLSRFATEVGSTAPLGGGLVALLRRAGTAIPGSLLPAAVTKAASLPAAGRGLRAATEGSVSGALTGEGDLGEKLALGAGGGVLGDRLVRAALRPITGFSKINPEAEALLGARIPVTIGQAQPDTMTGRAIRGLEDAATSIPFVGDLMVAGKDAGKRALAARAVSEGLPPGMVLPKSAKTQPLKALREVGDEFSKRYNQVLGKTEGPISFDTDALISRALPVKPKTGQVTSKAQRSRIEKAMRADLDIDDATPQQLFDVQSDWRKHATSLAKNPLKTARDRAEVKTYSEAAEEILDALEAGLPQGAELQALRGPYRNYVNLRHEAEKVKGFAETLTPTGIRKAARRANNSRLEDLARSAESILPSRLPDSGTARRTAQMALTGGLGYGAGSFALAPSLALGGAGLGLALPGLLATSQAGSKYLLGQHGWQQALERLLERTAAATGGAGAQ